MKIPNPYTLPAIDFVGGSTQDLIFHCYFYTNNRPHDLSSCVASFSIINYVNRYGEPIKKKSMTVKSSKWQDGEINNLLCVTLDPEDTVDLPAGKYIYQISIKSITGDVEINQGIIHIINNIHKDFVKNT